MISLILLITRENTRKSLRGNRFLANCWLMVLPPPPERSRSRILRNNTRPQAR